MTKIALLAAACLAVAPLAFATHNQAPLSSQSSSSSHAQAAAAAASSSEALSEVQITVAPVLVSGPTTAAATGIGGAGGQGGEGGDVTITAPRQAPSLGQGSLIPSGCGAGTNGGGSGTHGAGFLGFAWTTDECYLFMLGEKFATIGMPDTACDIWLQTKAAARAFKGKTKPSCTIPRASAGPQEVNVRLTSPIMELNLPTVPVQEPAPAPAVQCTPPAPAKRRPANKAPAASTCTK